jgi:excinuclease ABC subunit C
MIGKRKKTLPVEDTSSPPKDDILEKIKNLLKTIPQTPGIYKMKDEKGEIIYVGKAKNLRNRVAQYFQLSKSQSIKVKKMAEKVCDIDYTECNSELEALMLETNIIKELRPRYNVLMKDDKNYVYIKVSTHEDYPRLSLVRKREKDKALYFGPRTSADACEKMINILRKIFPIRTCTLEMEDGPNDLINITKKTIPVPCLDYHIKRCAGPCIDEIKKEEYNEMIKQIIRFLKGNYQELITRLKYRMFNFANEKKFEMAAKTRDQIKSLEGMFSKQLVSDPEFIDRDVIGVHPDFDKTFINLFQFREGKLINQENFTLDTPQNVSTATNEEQVSSVVESFLRSYYTESTEIPSEIFLREPPLDKDLWETWLTDRRKELQELFGESDRKKVRLLTPFIGKKNKVLELSEKNAATFARQSRAKWISDAAKTTQATRDLAEELGMEKELNRIECYDISHMGGEHTTASMVVFQKGSPEKKLYRHFKLKTLETGEIDDYASIKEILGRRLQRLSQVNLQSDKHYNYKKPLKKDFELILQSLKDEKIIPPVGDGHDHPLQVPDSKNFVGLYHQLNGDERLVGYTYFIEHQDEKTFELGYTWIEEEHYSRALKHQLWTHLFEKLKTFYVYTVANNEQKEDYLSYGFTELKKVPEFLKKNEDGGTGKDRSGPIPSGDHPRLCYLICKIQKKSTTDDSFSQIPDLIIIDGGKGQLEIARKVVEHSGLNIPVIGLAKKEEEVFMPLDAAEGVPPAKGVRGSGEEQRFRRIILPRNSQALYLVQRIRDESHRFANELRKKLGTTQLTASEIDNIPGVGLIIKRRLLKEYGSINAIKAAPMEQLEQTVGAYIAKMLKEKLGDTSK